jgi:hypothetical protein
MVQNQASSALRNGWVRAGATSRTAPPGARRHAVNVMGIPF